MKLARRIVALPLICNLVSSISAQALVVRIFDVFLVEGMKIVFKVAMHICKRLEPKLLKLEFEDMMTEVNARLFA